MDEAMRWIEAVGGRVDLLAQRILPLEAKIAHLEAAVRDLQGGPALAAAVEEAMEAAGE